MEVPLGWPDLGGSLGRKLPFAIIAVLCPMPKIRGEAGFVTAKRTSPKSPNAAPYVGHTDRAGK
jgi:hypothetical protein